MKNESIYCGEAPSKSFKIGFKTYKEYFDFMDVFYQLTGKPVFRFSINFDRTVNGLEYKAFWI